MLHSARRAAKGSSLSQDRLVFARKNLYKLKQDNVSHFSPLAVGKKQESCKGGYRLDKIIVTGENGSEISITEQADGTYRFTMPGTEVLADAEFVALHSFIDVQLTDWFYESVYYVSERGLMVGTAPNEFTPHLEASRAMLVTILHRLEGAPAATSPVSFGDVATGEWYTEAVAWATTP